MMEILRQRDGRYAVRDIGGAALDDVLAVFESLQEAEAWRLDRTLRDDQTHDGLGLLKPGGGQGLG
jgi:hypothetical protein